ncbi:hypothetical protein IWT25_01337 [Secundilactobacillus pentosiphilus]|uniref:Uncharacterized protein n=1 Tax=Secundilactobacillus pentosiphilus TaxID=1714682 RepID=A0A1Z5IWM9_9LACO|nr:hypothetical protein IWT25_01337 [Secundilactobacillus pentosiphilus]
MRFSLENKKIAVQADKMCYANIPLVTESLNKEGLLWMMYSV